MKPCYEDTCRVTCASWVQILGSHTNTNVAEKQPRGEAEESRVKNMESHDEYIRLVRITHTSCDSGINLTIFVSSLES